MKIEELPQKIVELKDLIGMPFTGKLEFVINLTGEDFVSIEQVNKI